jgi:hypothetical protein
VSPTLWYSATADLPREFVHNHDRPICPSALAAAESID